MLSPPLLASETKVDLANKTEAKKLSESLTQGGYVIYWRHTKTEKEQRDAANVNLQECATQRNLSDEGREQAKQVGEHFRRLGIKIGKVLSSPYCRCHESASLAFNYVEQDYNLYFSIDMNKSTRDTHSRELQKYLNTPPPKGQNTIIVGHTANLMEATGIWPSSEGVMHIFKPEKDEAMHLGFITIHQWGDL